MENISKGDAREREREALEAAREAVAEYVDQDALTGIWQALDRAVEAARLEGFRAGQEEMRERAASEFRGDEELRWVCKRLRALPLKERPDES